MSLIHSSKDMYSMYSETDGERHRMHQRSINGKDFLSVSSVAAPGCVVLVELSEFRRISPVVLVSQCLLDREDLGTGLQRRRSNLCGKEELDDTNVRCVHGYLAEPIRRRWFESVATLDVVRLDEHGQVV